MHVQDDQHLRKAFLVPHRKRKKTWKEEGTGGALDFNWLYFKRRGTNYSIFTCVHVSRQSQFTVQILTAAFHFQIEKQVCH